MQCADQTGNDTLNTGSLDCVGLAIKTRLDLFKMFNLLIPVFEGPRAPTV